MVRIGSKRVMLAGAAALAIMVSGSTGALAQNCGPIPLPLGANGLGLVGSAISAGVAASAAITAANTAFLTQSTAFVSAQPNARPGDDGGGVWTRGVGGDLTLKSNTSVNGVFSAPTLGLTVPGGTACNTKFHETFGGFQVGQDIAKLQIGDGWNIHIGTTAGAMESSGSIVGGSPAAPLFGPTTQVPFSTTTQSPFVGTYLVATRGNFFVDGLIRYDNYDLNLNSPGLNLFGQKVDAHGYSVSGSAGYNYHVPDSNWFVEPSAGFIWSHANVGTLNGSSPGFGTGVPGFMGTGSINDITSAIGRAGFRVGTTVETGNLVLQPFVAASIWHDFAGNITGNAQTCPNCLFLLGTPAALAGTLSTTNVGTFGQYSVGVSGQIVNTGWLGFVRIDYRNGDRLEGLSGTGGIRYQFTPDGMASAVMPVKAPLYKALPPPPVSWTGFYIGAYAGAAYGKADMNFPGVNDTGLNPSGILAGATLGYNYQIGTYVLGIEGDGGWTNTTASSACAPLVAGAGGFGNFPLFQMTCHEDQRWIATAAGRIGYLWTPRTLFYIKGGVAWADEKWSATCNLGPLNGAILAGLGQNCVTPGNPAPTPATGFSTNSVHVGGMIGYGAEFALTRNWSAKAELDWIEFGRKNLVASDGTAFTARDNLYEVKVGVNYHITP